MNKLTEVDKAYLAGLVDGEGCIFISKAKQSGRPWLISYRLLVAITQSDKPYLQFWQEKTGLGKVFLCNKKDAVYQWHCSSREGELLLRAIYDYLVLKKDQAKLALDFRRLQGSEGGGAAHKYDSRSLVNRREEMRQQLMTMKKIHKPESVEEDHSSYDPGDGQLFFDWDEAA